MNPARVGDPDFFYMYHNNHQTPKAFFLGYPRKPLDLLALLFDNCQNSSYSGFSTYDFRVLRRGSYGHADRLQ